MRLERRGGGSDAEAPRAFQLGFPGQVKQQQVEMRVIGDSR